VPLVLTPQLQYSPALTAVKVPVGGLASLSLLRPQQASVPLVRSPQL
jgi:hypothetical protein